jgi:hypothetical protein
MSNPGTYLLPGATETFQRVVDIEQPTNVRLVRLSVSAVFLTERRIKDTRSCKNFDYNSNASQFDNATRFIDEVNQPLWFSRDGSGDENDPRNGHVFCINYEIAPRNVIEKWIGNHPVLRVWLILNDPQDPGSEYPQIWYRYGAANGFDKPDPGRREERKLEEANPTAAYLDTSAEYAPADPKPPTGAKS